MRRALLFALLQLFILQVKAQPGILDPSFGSNGHVNTGTTFDATAFQIDGKMLGVRSTGGNIVVNRFNSDGSLDASFGSRGEVTTDLGSSQDRSVSVAVGVNGKIVVLASTTGNSPFHATLGALIRYSTNGIPDASFGVNGIVLNSYYNGHGYEDLAKVAFTNTGEVVITTHSVRPNANDAKVRRYNNDGSDAGFGNVSVGPYTYYRPTALLTGKDGEIVVAGSAVRSFFAYTVNAFFVKGYNSNSSNNIELAGTRTIVSGISQSVTAIAIQDNGKVIVAVTDNKLVRFNTNGATDSSFGSNGVVSTAFKVDKMVIGSDGKIILGGSLDGDFALAQYNSYGVLDTNFGNGGIATSDFGSNEGITEMLIKGSRLYAYGSGILAAYRLTSSIASSHLAYAAGTTMGSQAFGGELGMEFSVNSPNGIIIKQLGVFDHEGNGVTGTQSGGIRVAIFNKSTQTIVPGLDAIIAGLADRYVDNHRMKNINPVTLPPGNYVIVAKGYNTNELNGNASNGSPVISGDNGNGAISYSGAGLYGSDNPSTFSYPANADGGPANIYIAGTFNFQNNAINSSHLAYTTSMTTGNQVFGGELGMEFTVNNPNGILIRQLGAFDHQGNGITGTQSGGIRVAIFNKSTKTIVPGLDAVITGVADASAGNHRLKDVSPVQLMPGDYVVVAKGYNLNELNGNASGGTSIITGDNGNGAISYTGRGLYGSENPSTFDYPSNADGGPANIYNAGTFTFETNKTVAPSHLAYKAGTSTGNQLFLGVLGMEFTVNNPAGIQINQLGAFDHQGNGIYGTQSGGVRVAIFDKATKSIVPGLDVIITDLADGLSGNYRLKSITPITLMPGDYVVATKGYYPNELNGNASLGSSIVPGDDGGGAISFTGLGLYGSAFSADFAYPSSADGGPANIYLAGTFNYQVNTTSTSSHLAYTASTSTGSQAFGGELGMEFTVSNPNGIVVKQLGAFDHQGNGIRGSQNGGVRVAIFNKATKTIVQGLDAVIAGNADGYAGNHRMKNISPTTLMPGNYVVVAKGYNANELNGNGSQQTPVIFGDNGGGAINYTGHGLYGTDNPLTFEYPLSADGGPSNIYTAGTFMFEVPGNNPQLASIANERTMSRNRVAEAGATVAAITKLKEVKLYPNPSMGKFVLQLSNWNNSKTSLEIYNQTGQLLEKKSIGGTHKTTTLSLEINLEKEPAGMYFIKLLVGGEERVMKVVVQR